MLSGLRVRTRTKRNEVATTYYTGVMQEGIRLAGPSREVPLVSKLQFLFGGFYNQFGWAWFGFSSIHFRAFLFGLGADQGMPWAMYLVIVGFPLIGLSFIAIGLRKGLQALRLLTHGIPAMGRLVDRKPTNVQINDTPVIAMVFQFHTVDGRQARCVAKTHLTRDLEDDAEEPLVYDPEDSAQAVLLDDLPGKPRISDASVVRTREGGVWPLLILPAATILMHVVWTVLSR